MAKQATTKQSATKQDSEQFDNTDKSGEKMTTPKSTASKSTSSKTRDISLATADMSAIVEQLNTLLANYHIFYTNVRGYH